MKSTGVVRRIDSLGRIVLPKEIRKTLKLNSGDLLQIFIQKDQIVLEKYSPLSNFDKTTESVLNVLYKVLNMPALITDKKSVISAVGSASRLKNLPLSDSFISIIDNKSSFLINHNDKIAIKKITASGDENGFISQIIVPVLDIENTPIGSVALLWESKNCEFSLKELNAVNFASKILVEDLD